MRFFSRNKAGGHFTPNMSASDASDEKLALDKTALRQTTRTRSAFGWAASACLWIAVVMLILVEVGSTYNRSVLRNIYFIQLDLSAVVPASVPNARLLNSIAQTLGLHDFYRVGLWGFCQGYFNEGTTSCTAPETLYWFNPVAIIQSQLIAGASIQLPSDLSDILGIIQIASNWMFGLFLAGACLSFVLGFVMPLAVYSRWIAALLALLAFFNALIVAAACVIATVMFVIMQMVFRDNQDVNIGAQLGTTMFGLMWTAAGLAIFAWLFQLGLCCCCVSRRDVRRGKSKVGRRWRAKRAEQAPAAVSAAVPAP